MSEKMIVYVDGKEAVRPVASYEHIHHNQDPKPVPVLQVGERMMRSFTGEVHIIRS